MNNPAYYYVDLVQSANDSDNGFSFASIFETPTNIVSGILGDTLGVFFDSDDGKSSIFQQLAPAFLGPGGQNVPSLVSAFTGAPVTVNQNSGQIAQLQAKISDLENKMRILVNEANSKFRVYQDFEKEAIDKNTQLVSQYRIAFNMLNDAGLVNRSADFSVN